VIRDERGCYQPRSSPFKPNTRRTIKKDMTTLSLHDRLEQLRDALLHNLIEREVPVRLALLAALCGEHILLVGPPGTAKSEIARRLRHAFKDASFFERLLTRFSVPEELFGPLSIKGLENDKYERQIEGYLPTAHVAFIDEIFKANSAILNALLTLLNERRFDQGSAQIDTPLICAIGASNEYPEGEELEALYDRFLLRYHVSPVSDASFGALLDLEQLPFQVEDQLKFSAEEIAKIQEGSHNVQIPDSIKKKLMELRTYLNSEKAKSKLKDLPPVHPARNFYISDRRWRKIIKLLKISAHTNGRGQVNDLDLLILIDATWNLPQQRDIIKEWLLTSMGAETIDMPQTITKLINTYREKCEKFENNNIQKTDKKGNPLFLGKNDEEIVGEKSGPPPQRPKSIKNENLYESPDGKAQVTEKNLIEYIRAYSHYENQIHKNGSWIRLDQYLIKYLITESCPPSMTQQMASKAQVNHMCVELSNSCVNAANEKSKIQEKLNTIYQNFQAHLWLHDNNFIEKTSTQMKEHIALLSKLEKDIEALIKRLECVPQEEP
jgi:MoxR-like ATPase